MKPENSYLPELTEEYCQKILKNERRRKELERADCFIEVIGGTCLILIVGAILGFAAYTADSRIAKASKTWPMPPLVLWMVGNGASVFLFKRVFIDPKR